MTLYQALVKEVPMEDIHNHYSDLYVKVSPKSTRILRNYVKENNLGSHMYSMFKSNVEGEGLMWEVHLAYDPYWEECVKKSQRITKYKEESKNGGH